MRALDIAIIVIFLVGMPLLGVLIGGRQKSATDYFVSEKKISWWVVCVSVVSAETSTLTVLSVPVVAYLAPPSAGGMWTRRRSTFTRLRKCSSMNACKEPGCEGLKPTYSSRLNVVTREKSSAWL